MSKLALTILALAISGSSMAQDHDELASLIKKRFGTTGWHGVVGVVDSNKSIVYSFGFESPVARIPMSQYSIFPIAPITRSLIGLKTLAAVQSGLLSPTDTIGKFINGMPKHIAAINVASLADHSARLPDYRRHLNPAQWTSQDVMNWIGKLGTDFRADTSSWSFSPTHYVVLAEVLAAAEGREVLAMLRNVANEFNMLQAEVVSARSPHLMGYNEQQKPVNVISQTMGDGGLLSNSNDLLAVGETLNASDFWAKLLLGSHDTVRPGVGDSTWTYHYGWFCSATGENVCSNGGRSDGFEIYHRWYPDRKLYWFILTNRYHVANEWFRNEVGKLLVRE